MLLNIFIIFCGDICKIPSELNYFTYIFSSGFSYLLNHVPCTDNRCVKNLDTMSNDAMKQILISFYDDNLKTREAKLYGYHVTVVRSELCFNPQYIFFIHPTTPMQQMDHLSPALPWQNLLICLSQPQAAPFLSPSLGIS